MAVVQAVCVCLVGVVAGQQAWTLPETTTPVPILRYIDRQNSDGSYTYGFESGDGTYKIETRLSDGQVRGKYGYYDPEGELREASYGATSEGGFEPRIQGVVLPPTYRVQEENEVEPAVIFQLQETPRKFRDFPVRKTEEVTEQGEVKLVNGRRAILKRRLVKKPVTVRPEEDKLRARQVQLTQLRQQRRKLAELEQRQIQSHQIQSQQQPSSSSRQEAFRSFRAPQTQITQYQAPGPAEPYVTHGAQFGSYSISY
jgi:hypothetical protein